MEFVKIAMLENEFEAQMLETVLAANGIPHQIRSYQDDVYGNLFQVTRGWGVVQAPEANKAEIMAILEELRNAPIEPLED